MDGAERAGVFLERGMGCLECTGVFLEEGGLWGKKEKGKNGCTGGGLRGMMGNLIGKEFLWLFGCGKLDAQILRIGTR
jgi:hypothetical protein